MEGGKSSRTRCLKLRFLVCTLGLAAMMISQMSRVVINFCITSMVDTSMIVESTEMIATGGSCPVPGHRVAQNRSDRAIFMTREVIDRNLDVNLYSDLEIDNADTATYHDHSDVEPDKFKWTVKQQNLLLGGFYYSYFVVMILAGRLAEIYGPKRTILVAMSGSAIINLATPWMARNSYELLVASRLVMGSIQSCVFPSLYVLFFHWLTMTEASIFAPLLKLSIKCGTLLASIVSGLMNHWADVFYVQGAIFVVYALLWILISSSDPADNYWVSTEEVHHIKRKKPPASQIEPRQPEQNHHPEKIQGQSETESASKSTPWLRLLTSPSVLGLCLAKMTINCSADFIAIELPSYLKFVHHASKETISTITSSIALVQITFTIVFSWVAKVVLKRQPYGLSRTCLRRIFQGVANFGQFVCFMMITLDTCNTVYVSIMLQLAAFTMMSLSGGEPMVPFELSSEYLATIVAISNSAANLAGTSITIVTSAVLGDEGGNYKRWNTLMMLVAVTNLVGGLGFCTMVRSEPIDFNSKRRSGKNRELDRDNCGDRRADIA